VDTVRRSDSEPRIFCMALLVRFQGYYDCFSQLIRDHSRFTLKLYQEESGGNRDVRFLPILSRPDA